MVGVNKFLTAIKNNNPPLSKSLFFEISESEKNNNLQLGLL